MGTNNMSKPESLDLPVNKGICFSNHKKEFKEKIRKDQIKLLTKFASFLKRLLEPGEEVLLAVTATSPMSFLEQGTTGWVIYYLKRCVLVFTNKRILHFPTKSNYSPKHSLSQIRYGDIEKFKLSGFLGRVLKFEYKSGKKENFCYIKSREFRKLKTLQSLLAETHQPSKAMERHSLCPKCIAPLLKNVFSCPNCHLEFKNVKDAIKYSIIFPGGGYFYAGHPFLGIMDAITEGILLIVLTTRVLEALKGAESWGSVFFIAIILFFEKLITIYHAKHYVSEFIPADKDFLSTSLHSAPEPYSPYEQPSQQGQRKWPKLAFAIILLVFSMSFLGWKLYPYLEERFRGPTQHTLREIPEDAKMKRTMAAFLETKYTRIDDDEKWISALYQNKDFDAVEKHISDLLSQSEDEAKTYELYSLYYTLGDVKEDKEVNLKKNILDEWCGKHPESHIPWLVRGNFYIFYAWHLRGSGWAKEVAKEAWPKFHAMLEQAKADLEKSYQLNSKDPNSSCFLLIVARGLSLPTEEMEEYFKNSIASCPWHIGSHWMKLEYLKAKWNGSWEEMHGFATDCSRFSEQYPFLGLVMVEALEEIHHWGSKKNENYLGRSDVWPTIENLYTNFFAKYPGDLRRRFSYAYHAFIAQKYDIAIRQFEIIGDRWMENGSWNSLKDYNHCRAFAYSARAATVPPKQAVEYLKKSIEVDPTKKIPHFNLGGFKRIMGEYEEAEKAFLKVIELDPREGKAYLQLSCMFWKDRKDLVKAKEYAQKALTCDLAREEKREAKECIEFCDKMLKNS